MKEKIIAELKKQGLPESLAKFVNVQNESEIEGAVSELKSFIPATLEDALKSETLKGQYQTALQREADRRVTDALKTHETTLKEKYDFVEKSANPKKDGNEPKSELEKQIAELATIVKTQSEMITGFANQNKLEQKKATISAKLKAKGIPESWAGRVLNIEDDKLEEAISGLETEHTAYRQSVVDEIVKNGGKPPRAQGDLSSAIGSKVKEIATQTDPEKSGIKIQTL